MRPGHGFWASVPSIYCQTQELSDESDGILMLKIPTLEYGVLSFHSCMWIYAHALIAI